MTGHPTTEHLGEPDLKIAGFALWVHGRAYPDSPDEYDRDWLRVTAHSGGFGASVFVSGSILGVTDLVGWSQQCDALAVGKTNEAALTPYEPELEVLIRPSDSLGHFAMRVHITPEHLTQRHEFRFAVDQTDLREIGRRCRAIVAAHPVRGREGKA